MMNTMSRFSALLVSLLIVLVFGVGTTDAQISHEIEKIAVIPISASGIHDVPPAPIPVFASPYCLKKTDRESLEAEARWLVTNYGNEVISQFSFICGPEDRMPKDHVIGFAFMWGGMWTRVEVSLHVLGTEGRFSDRTVFDHGLCGSPAVQGYLGPVGDPWGFVGFNLDCESTYTAVYDFKTGTTTILDSWGSDILEESGGIVDLVWMKAEGVHYHHSDPVVVWKVFRGAKSPELIDQQLEWPQVDDKPGVTLRIHRDYEARAAAAATEYPQSIP